jgi:TonB family protein
MRSKTFLVLGLAATMGAAGMLAGQTQGAQTQDAPEVVTKGGPNVTPPRVTYAPPAEFSEAARAAKYQGTCILKLIVGADGNPRNIRVINPIGMGLDEKALEAVRTWKFQPALKDGKPVAAEIAVEVDFHLFGAGPSIADLARRANAGDAKAQLELANAYFKGKGTPKDELTGLNYLEKAANQGVPRAQFEMGEHIIHEDASADNPKAYMWYTLASRGGYKHSEKALKELAARMTPEQLQAGQTLVDNWTNVPAKSASPR